MDKRYLFSQIPRIVYKVASLLKWINIGTIERRLTNVSKAKK